MEANTRAYWNMAVSLAVAVATTAKHVAGACMVALAVAMATARSPQGPGTVNF